MSRLDVVIPAHNAASTLERVLIALKRQRFPGGYEMGVYVVDDGSTDATSRILTQMGEDYVNLICLPECSGRAVACNRGAAAGNGDYLLFLDADCIPVDDNCLACHLAILSHEADACFGAVSADGDDFWAQYMRRLEAERSASAVLGNFLALTSANLALKRAVFETVGGFDEGYTQYGFEDRDLIARLKEMQVVMRYEPMARIFHEAGNSVQQVCAKMRMAARFSAGRFSARHPGVYRDMSFSKLDSSAWPRIFRWPAYIISMLDVPWSSVAELVVRSEWAPWAYKRFALKSASALAYLHGSLVQRLDDSRLS